MGLNCGLSDYIWLVFISLNYNMYYTYIVVLNLLSWQKQPLNSWGVIWVVLIRKLYYLHIMWTQEKYKIINGQYDLQQHFIKKLNQTPRSIFVLKAVTQMQKDSTNIIL